MPPTSEPSSLQGSVRELRSGGDNTPKSPACKLQIWGLNTGLALGTFTPPLLCCL